MITATSQYSLLLQKNTATATKIELEIFKYCQQCWVFSYKRRVKQIAFHSHH